MFKYLTILFLSLVPYIAYGQEGVIRGKIISQGQVVEYANVGIKNTSIGTTSNDSGYFELTHLEYANYELIVSHISFQSYKQNIQLSESEQTLTIEIELHSLAEELDQVVISATRTNKRKTDTPIIVNVLSSEAMNAVQACSVSEGLRFQPGLRVETDCQTCNYTQLRMNGLGGSYSQILINGRPIFSPLTGLYGLEQLPTNMVDRIEVIRGSGSALYGSSAIGGTVNIITRLAKENAYNLDYTAQSINGSAYEGVFNGNLSLVNQKDNMGLTLFINKRDRDYYDHNGDNYSELPKLSNFSLGSHFFYQPKENQKLELNLNYINEYRYGGEMVDTPAHLAQQAEEREHDVWMGSADYQINFANDNSSLIFYLAGQSTDRTHYTGIVPDSLNEVNDHMENPPYGSSQSSTFQIGSQFNHRVQDFPLGSNVFTIGSEFLYDKVFDEIASYNYLIDQETENIGVFLQSDWNMWQSFNLLTGLRVDKHNLLNQSVWSPRISLLYKLKSKTQFRLSWGKGFRAPQAFDTDLHIAFAGGGVSRISLADNLHEERSSSLSASVNYDNAKNFYIYGFTLEGFYTQLSDAFYQHPIGYDEYGLLFEKRNGPGATVYGTTIELRANYNRKVQLEAGLTLQRSLYDEAVENIEGIEAKQEFLRSPNDYGYATLLFTPNKRFTGSLNLVYTGKMDIAHFAGAPEQNIDEYKQTPAFTELGFKLAYSIPIIHNSNAIEFFGGIKNLFNAYQNDFDTGKNRDSNYVYGPGQPRTFFFGIRLKSL